MCNDCVMNEVCECKILLRLVAIDNEDFMVLLIDLF